MPGDVGNQTVVVKFFDDIDSAVVNRIARDVRKVGIYSGGYLSIGSNISVTLSPLDCEIGDGTHQVRVLTGASVPIAVGIATPYVVLRWIYTGSAANDYMDFVAVSSGGLLTNDLIVGVCVYTGANLTGIDYTRRANPLTLELFLKVEPTVAASMYVRIRGGRVNYGSVNYDVIDQLSSVFAAPGAGSRIDVIYVDTDGIVKVIPGVAGSPGLVPDYGGKIVLAEITILSTDAVITANMIKDVRGVSAGYPTPNQFVAMTGDQTVAGIKTFSSFPVTPSSDPTTNYQTANKKYVDDKDAADVKLTGNQTIAGIKTFSSSPIVPTPTTDYQAATKKYADDRMPSGVILLWSGSIATIPAGWLLCNGAGGTPDLRSRFIIGATTDSVGVGIKVGSKNAAHITGTDNSLNIDSGLDAKEPGGGGCSPQHLNMIPDYYALAYIMKS